MPLGNPSNYVKPDQNEKTEVRGWLGSAPCVEGLAILWQSTSTKSSAGFTRVGIGTCKQTLGSLKHAASGACSGGGDRMVCGGAHRTYAPCHHVYYNGKH